MSKPLLEKHARAVELRKRGWSYSAIKKQLRVSQSSLSLWLRDYPLSHEQLDSLLFHNEKRIENFRRTMRKKREDRLKKVYKQESASLLPISERELYIAGLMMYWGEGLKATSSTVSVANTDPAVIVFVKRWLQDCLGVETKKMRVKLHLYEDMDIEYSSGYWSKILDLPLSQFVKPYVKKSKLINLDQKGLFGHGTCNLTINDTFLKEKIVMGYRAIADYVGRPGLEPGTGRV